MKANLCKCNNCDAILIDENPQFGAVKHELKGIELYMEQFEEEGAHFYGCPNCETDNYLIDL